MNLKIQGGGNGAYSNSGSSFGTVSYMNHEDAQRQEQRQEVEPFFNHDKNVSGKNVVKDIDQNKAKLSKNDAKFFVMTVSPSPKELQAMGRTPQEQSEALKEYVRNDVMKNYAENFNKGLNEKDIKYAAKIHHGRGNNTDNQMHCHIIISRKDMSNTKKLSPQTNHKSAERSGTVKSAFNRSQFYQNCEKSFDQRFGYKRAYSETFEYNNAIKNGSIKEKESAIRKNADYKIQQNNNQNKQQESTKDFNKKMNYNVNF